MSLTTPEVVPFRPDLAHYFGALNREWIERYFVVEEADLIVFNDPLAAIVEPGGQIFFVTVGDEVFGTCAVIRCNSKLYELAKMAVSPVARGHGDTSMHFWPAWWLIRCWCFGLCKAWFQTNLKKGVFCKDEETTYYCSADYYYGDSSDLPFCDNSLCAK